MEVGDGEGWATSSVVAFCTHVHTARTHAPVHTVCAGAAALRAALAEAEAENADLKAELNAFDPKFFEEIEDLKHDHYVLGNKVRAHLRTPGTAPLHPGGHAWVRECARACMHLALLALGACIQVHAGKPL